MTREEIHEEIASLIKLMEINNNRMILNDSSRHLDLDQMKEHIVRLYTLHDHLRVMGDVPAQTKVVEEKVEEEIQAEKEVEKVEVKKEEPKPKKKKKLKFKPAPEEPEVVPEPEPVVEVIEEVQEVETVEPEPQPEPEPEPEPEVVEVPPTPPKVEKPVVKPAVKKVAPKPKGNVYQRLKNTKIDSIKKGISISKRYEIQNGLFGNDAEAYNQAIATMDNSTDLAEAKQYLKTNLSARDKWDEEDGLVEEILTLLERRYM